MDISNISTTSQIIIEVLIGKCSTNTFLLIVSYSSNVFSVSTLAMRDIGLIVISVKYIRTSNCKVI